MDGFEYQLMDLKGLLLLKYKEYQLSEDECIVLMMLLMYEYTSLDARGMIQQKTNFDQKKVDTLLIELIKKRWIAMNGVHFDLDLLKQRLISRNEVEEKKETVDLLTAFEKEFGRGLNPSEMEAIRTWKNSGYEDSMILEALKEASLRNIQSIRYIEAIIRDWSKNGIRRSGKEKIQPKEIVEYNDYRWWEED